MQTFQTDTINVSERSYETHMMVAETLMYIAPHDAANAAVFAHQHAIKLGSVEGALQALMLLQVIQAIPVECESAS